MKAKNAQTIGEVMAEYLNPARLDDFANERRVEAMWSEVVGPYVTKLTTKRYVKSRVLHVQITSAPLRNDLMINRSKLVERLNEAVGVNVIDNIVFR